MSTTEERARAAMRAIAGTVNDAPPLRLTPARDAATDWNRASAPDEMRFGPRGDGRPSASERRRPHRPGGPGRRDSSRPASHGRVSRRRSLLAPVAAVIAVVAVATTLAVLGNARSRPMGATAPTSSAVATHPDASGPLPAARGLPEYYVAWMQAASPYLIIADTFTGQKITTFTAPDGVSLTGGVYGTTSDDRAFIVTGEELRGPDKGATVWYLLRITSGVEGGPPAILETLSIPVRQRPAGVALSPDGTEVAVAVAGRPATLRVYSVVSGALLRQWSTRAAGEFTAQKADAGSWPLTASVLRWSPDGKQLAFAWNASVIRVLTAAGPARDLMTDSKPLAAIGTTYGTLSSLTCDAASGWNLLAGGQKVICAGSEQTGAPPGNIADGWTCPPGDRVSVGFVWEETTASGSGFGMGTAAPECPGKVTAQNAYGAHIGWTSADGTEIIGLLPWPGHVRFGIFNGTVYTLLPTLPDSWGDPSIVLNGAEAF